MRTLSHCPLTAECFRWSNGIQVTIEVEKVKEWGEHSDFCDGCLALEPDDYRFVLRFTVHVPKSYGKLLDVTSCSGTLSVDEGNDDDAFTQVAGDYNKNLDGKVRAGATNYGANEYGIKTEVRRARNHVHLHEPLRRPRLRDWRGRDLERQDPCQQEIRLPRRRASDTRVFLWRTEQDWPVRALSVSGMLGPFLEGALNDRI